MKSKLDVMMKVYLYSSLRCLPVHVQVPAAVGVPVPKRA